MKMKHLSYAVTLALGAGLVQLANADDDSEYLFPYVVKDANRTTVITLICDDDCGSVGSPEGVHLQYWTKSTTAANTAACEPNSSVMNFTANDVASWDTAGLLGAGALFGDTTTTAPLGASISYAGPRHGYLLARKSAPQGNDLAGGFWVEVDLANGGAHGDVAVRGDGNLSGNGGLTHSGITNAMALFPTTSASTGGTARSVAFWPLATVSTVFTVTPLGSAMEDSDNNTVVMQVFNTNDVQGAYDRNENGIDGTVPQTVRCVGRLTPAQLMPGVVVNASWAAQGGWGWLMNLGDGDANAGEGNTIDLNALVYQVDTSNAAGAGKFMSNAMRLTSNDGT